MLTCNKCHQDKEDDLFLDKGVVRRACQPCRREQAKLQQRKWRAKNPERSREIVRNSRAKKGVPYYRDYQRERHTGWNREQFDRAWREQAGKCAICNCLMLPEGRQKQSVAADHCHKSMTIRALLCRQCNNGLGNFQDNIDFLKNAISYIGRFS